MAEAQHKNGEGFSGGGADRVASSSDSSIVAAITAKICCICGCDLHGKVRYKDSDGRYWCAPCNEADIAQRQPATCPDCRREMLMGELQEFKGTMVCQPCWEKRRQSSKREEARLRAVEAAAADEARRRHLWKLAVITAIVVLVIYGIYMLVHMMTVESPR